MAEKILKFDNSITAYQNLVDLRIEQGDVEGALSILLDLSKKSKNVLIYRDIAHLYGELDMHEESAIYWFLYLDRAPKKAKAEAYRGLGDEYFYLGNIPASSYYYNENVIHSGQSVELDDEIFDCFTRLMESEEDKPRFVYPPQSVDYTQTMSNAKEKMLTGDIDQAISLYESVHERSEHYEEARCQLAVAYFMKGDIDGAIRVNESYIENVNPDCVFALCTLSSMYGYRGETLKSGETFARIKIEKAKGINDYYKIATCACEHKKYETAKICFEKILLEKPYEKSINYMLAVTEYNLGNKERAKSILGKMVRLTGDAVCKYYYDYIDSRDGETAKKPLSFLYRLPDEEIKRRTDILTDIVKKSSKQICKIIKDKEVSEILTWCFSQSEIEFQKLGAYLVALSSPSYAEKYFLPLLIKPIIYDEIKEYLVRMLVLDGFDKTIGVVVSNIYKKVVFKNLEIDNDERSINFLDGYATAFAYTAIYTDKSTDKICDSALEIYFKFFNDDFVANSEGEDIAPIIYLNAGHCKVNSPTIVARQFKRKEEVITKLWEHVKGQLL